MNIILILTVSFALSIDAFAMMTANFKAYDKAGIKIKVFAVLLIALLHALFVFVGKTVAGIFFSNVGLLEYFIALIFLLLSIKCVFSKQEDNTDKKSLDIKLCVIQAIITSIDAFIGGITLITTPVHIGFILIGVFMVTAFMTALGLIVGRFLKDKLKNKEKFVSAILFLILAVISIKDVILT